MGLALFKDKSEETVSNPVATKNDSNDLNQVRYNFRKRKIQEEQDYQPTNVNKKLRPTVKVKKGKKKETISELPSTSHKIITRRSMTTTVSREQEPQRHTTKKKAAVAKNIKMKEIASSSKNANVFEKISIKTEKKPVERKKQSSLKSITDRGQKANAYKRIHLKLQKTKPVKTKKSSPSTSARKEAKSSKKSPNSRKRSPTKEKQAHTSSKKTTQSARKRKLNAKKEKTEQPRAPTKTKHRFAHSYRLHPGNFANMFLKKAKIKSHIKNGNYSTIHGISVSHDNLIWVNYLSNRINLHSSSGSLLRSIDLSFAPVFNTCMPNGDILVTQGCSGGSKPAIHLISREGNTKLLVNLTSEANNLYGILCLDERIYVISDKDALLQLDMHGEIRRVYEYESKSEHLSINHVFSQKGALLTIKTNTFTILPVGDDSVSSGAINKAQLGNTYSASLSVDNYGNIIVGRNSNIVVVDPSLESSFEIECNFDGEIRATAVDQENQLWVGTVSGNLYVVNYLK